MLILPPYWLRPYVAQHNFAKAPTISEYQVPITKEKPPQPRPVKKDFSEKALRRYLQDTFAEYGLTEKLPEAKYTIFKESSWIWNVDNGVSKGLTQFTLSTWIDNCTLKDERDNPYKSIDCMAKLWARGEQGRWDAWCVAFPNDDWRCESRGL